MKIKKPSKNFNPAPHTSLGHEKSKIEVNNFEIKMLQTQYKNNNNKQNSLKILRTVLEIFKDKKSTINKASRSS